MEVKQYCSLRKKMALGRARPPGHFLVIFRLLDHKKMNIVAKLGMHPLQTSHYVALCLQEL